MEEKCLKPNRCRSCLITEPIVLPGMVVPIELDDAARVAVDAAQASESGKLLIAPRLDDRYPTHGVVARSCRSAGCPAAAPPPLCVASDGPTSVPAPPAPARHCGLR